MLNSDIIFACENTLKVYNYELILVNIEQYYKLKCLCKLMSDH